MTPTSPVHEPPERRARVAAVEDDDQEDLELEPEEELELEDLDDSSKEVIDAKKKELTRMTEFGIFDLVAKEDTVGKHFLSTRWVVVSRTTVCGRGSWRGSSRKARNGWTCSHPRPRPSACASWTQWPRNADSRH